MLLHLCQLSAEGDRTSNFCKLKQKDCLTLCDLQEYKLSLFIYIVLSLFKVIKKMF